MREWKPEYAPVRPSQYPTYCYPAYIRRGVFHHVHPALPGIAHCRTNVRLDLEKLAEQPPSDDLFCQNCRRLEELHGADGQQTREEN